MMEFNVGVGTRRCSKCWNKIPKGQLFLDACFRGHRESNTINLCLVCLDDAIKKVGADYIEKVRGQQLLEAL